MNYIKKNRFLVWLMWLIPIACTGWVGVVTWTVIQICLANDEEKHCKELKIPVKERDDVKEMNKEENLTEHDKFVMENTKGLIKIDEGVYYYERK